MMDPKFSAARKTNIPKILVQGSQCNGSLYVTAIPICDVGHDTYSTVSLGLRASNPISNYSGVPLAQYR